MPCRHRLLGAGVLGTVALTAALSAAGSVPVSADPVPSTSSTTTSVSTPATSGGPASSPLCTAAVITSAKALVQTDLTNRVTQLNLLVGRVNGAVHLTTSDQSTLLADLTQSELPGIQALQAKVSGDTTCIELLRDAHAMVFDYRVYLLMTPQADLVILNDAITYAEGVVAALETRISGGIHNAQERGQNVSGAQSAFADYQAQVTAAQSLTSSQSATLLAQTPQGYPGNATVLRQARTNLSNARNDLHAARADLAQIVQDLT